MKSPSYRPSPMEPTADPAPLAAAEWQRLLPWEQVARLHASHRRRHPAPERGPRLQLCGDRAYLRALRAAELTAWEAA